jgi:hypothetical protein
MCLEKAEDDGDLKDEVEGITLPTGQYHQTAFSALLAKQSTSEVKEARPPPVWEQQLKSSQGSYTQMVSLLSQEINIVADFSKNSI